MDFTGTEVGSPFEGFELVAVGECEICGDTPAPLFETNRMPQWLVCDGCILKVMG
jgi:hypothetical protein